MTTLNWGILGAGAISGTFFKDCLVDPSTRNVSDVHHKVVGVASRDSKKAQAFIDSHAGHTAHKSEIKAFGSYEALVHCPEVKAVYIGTPHSYHYENAKLCIQAGKHVLCEKPMTVNASQARQLAKLAREKRVFLMEAVWTRFFPLTHALQKILASGEIGEVLQVTSDLSVNFGVDQLEPSHRMVDPSLAGGAMLDLGPYPWTYIALSLLHPLLKPAGSAFSDPLSSNTRSAPLPIDPPLETPKITASVVPYRHPGAATASLEVDASTVAVLEFPTPSGRKAQGVFIASMRTHTPEDCSISITGTKGRIRIPFPPYRPEKLYLTTYASERDCVDLKDPTKHEELHDFPLPGGGTWGFVWEADETARCIAAGKVESPRMPHRETILMMEVFDEIRRQGGINFPAAIESASGDR